MNAILAFASLAVLVGTAAPVQGDPLPLALPVATPETWFVSTGVSLTLDPDPASPSSASPTFDAGSLDTICLSPDLTGFNIPISIINKVLPRNWHIVAILEATTAYFTFDGQDLTLAENSYTVPETPSAWEVLFLSGDAQAAWSKVAKLTGGYTPTITFTATDPDGNSMPLLTWEGKVCSPHLEVPDGVNLKSNTCKNAASTTLAGVVDTVDFTTTLHTEWGSSAGWKLTNLAYTYSTGRQVELKILVGGSGVGGGISNSASATWNMGAPTEDRGGEGVHIAVMNDFQISRCDFPDGDYQIVVAPNALRSYYTVNPGLPPPPSTVSLDTVCIPAGRVEPDLDLGLASKGGLTLRNVQMVTGWVQLGVAGSVNFAVLGIGGSVDFELNVRNTVEGSTTIHTTWEDWGLVLYYHHGLGSALSDVGMSALDVVGIDVPVVDYLYLPPIPYNNVFFPLLPDVGGYWVDQQTTTFLPGTTTNQDSGQTSTRIGGLGLTLGLTYDPQPGSGICGQ